jgi:hypothetical protein
VIGKARRNSIIVIADERKSPTRSSRENYYRQVDQRGAIWQRPECESGCTVWIVADRSKHSSIPV